MATTSQIVALSEAPTIASYSLQPEGLPEIEIGQAEHRIRLINLWSITPGSRVLELGCGQGPMTAVLAHTVGPNGHVDAVDPASLDYGSPFTLGQAQAYMSESAVGGRVSWHQATPEDFLDATLGGEQQQHWDVAVLSHCIWYFSSPAVLGSILAKLKGRATRVCIAEYALRATERAAAPHVLAVQTRATLEAYKEASSQNVRTPLSPRAIKEAAAGAGYSLAGEGMLVPEVGLRDGFWEVSTVTSPRFLKEIADVGVNDRMRAVLETGRDATVAAVEALDGAQLMTMDVWAASFE